MRARLLTTTLVPTLIATLMLGACAKVDEKTLGWASTTVDALVLINNQLLTGEVVLVPDRTGRATFAGKTGVVRSCTAAMHATATQQGVFDLHCNDGTDVQLDYKLLSETRGYAYGKTSQGVASLTFGLSPKEASAYLVVPAGKAIVERGGGASLELQAEKK